MSPDLDKALCEKYPKIFKNREASIMETCMAWGFECEDGWFDIIDIMCHEIQTYIDWKSQNLSAKDLESLQIVADQVKEKYGTLRFYYSGGDEVIEGIVRMAESMTHRTCESCGCPGDPRKGGWIKVLCDACDDKWKTSQGVIRCK